MSRTALLLLLIAVFGWAVGPARGDEPAVAFTKARDRVEIRVNGRPFATYVYRDKNIPRPYFKDVFAPNGERVTRNQPPVSGRDLTDHPTFHPGVWLAFGDLNGADFWRNKAAVEPMKFVKEPAADEHGGRFRVLNRYRVGEKVRCDETCAVTVRPRPNGVLLTWDSEFRADSAVVFGDQEEMGLGVRLATPLTGVKGGRVVNSAGQVGEKEAWGKVADWCVYGGSSDGKSAGVVLMSDPRNFRKAWFHVRDYGLMVANPFGRQAFTKGAPSRVTVGPDNPLRLRFGVFVYAGEPDGAAAYRDYLKTVGE